MANVYSESLSHGHAGDSTAINPEDGYITVIRWVTAFNANELVGETFHMFEQDTEITLLQVVVSQRSSYVQELRIVMWEPFLIEFSNDGDIDYTVSGYRLKLP